MKWEYRSEKIDWTERFEDYSIKFRGSDQTTVGFVGILNTVGKDNWELVNLVPCQNNSTRIIQYQAIFKRPTG